jgi:hypothetical protein
MSVKATSTVPQRLQEWATRHKVGLDALTPRQMARASKDLGLSADRILAAIVKQSSTGMEKASAKDGKHLAPQLPKPVPIVQREVFGGTRQKISVQNTLSAFRALTDALRPPYGGDRPDQIAELFEQHQGTAKRLAQALEELAPAGLKTDFKGAANALRSHWERFDPNKPEGQVREAIVASQQELERLAKATDPGHGKGIDAAKLLGALVHVVGASFGFRDSTGLGAAASRVADELEQPQRGKLKDAAAQLAEQPAIRGVIPFSVLKQNQARLVKSIEKVAETL